MAELKQRKVQYQFIDSDELLENFCYKFGMLDFADLKHKYMPVLYNLTQIYEYETRKGLEHCFH